MKSTSVFVFCFLMPVVLVTSQIEPPAPSVHVTISKTIALPGDEVTVTCRLSHISNYQLVNVLKVIVRQAGAVTPGSSQFLTEIIMQNAVLMPPYKDGRFEATPASEGNEVIYTLKIKNVQVNDSGHYVCTAPALEDFYAGKLLQVYRKPEAILYYDNALFTNYSLSLREKERLPISCITPNILPEPGMSMVIENEYRVLPAHPIAGGEVSMQPRDVTDLFLVSSQLNERCTENVGVKGNCPLSFDYDMIVENRNYLPSFLDDGRMLTCYAKMRDLDKDSANASVKLDITYTPKFKCTPAAPHYVAVNSTNYQIQCVIFANPPAAANENRKWTAGSCQANGEMIQDTPNIKLQEPLVSADGKKRTMSITIGKITPDLINRKFCLRVRNDIAEEVTEITLLDVLAKPPNSAGSLRATLLSIVLFVISVMQLRQLLL